MSCGPQTESLYLITYVQDGLLRRDSYYQEPTEAQAHCTYLQNLFPEAQVQLHSLAVDAVPFSPTPERNGFAFLEF